MKHYKVKTDIFEGPLDLLLHLINKLEIDIYDIPMAEITDQYLAFIQTMKKIELNIASEYLVMAATLIHIKSKMLLPKENIEIDDNYEEDPREELIERLIEYRKYKEAALKLKEKETGNEQSFTRPPIMFQQVTEKRAVVQGDLTVYDMIDALEKVLKRKSWIEPIETTIDRFEISIEDAMLTIVRQLKNTSSLLEFNELFPVNHKRYIVTTFLALLELMKEQKINIQQADRFAPIYVKLREGI